MPRERKEDNTNKQRQQAYQESGGRMEGRRGGQREREREDTQKQRKE